MQGGDKIVYGLGPLYAVKADGSTLTFARDGGKSVRAEVSSTGTVTASFRYRAYGETAQWSGVSAPTYLGYAGQLVDPSGLYYMRARWYDPATGRFISRDPLPGEHSIPVSLNAFLYAHASPTVLDDPTGTCAILGPICVALLAAAVQVAGVVPVPDYVKAQAGFENPLGVHTTVVLDRNGNLYVQPAGFAAGSPGPFGSITVGWLLQEQTPSEEELRSFNEGLAFSGGGAAGVAVDLVWSPDANARTKYALELGVGSPRAGVAVGYAGWATQFGIQW